MACRPGVRQKQLQVRTPMRPDPTAGPCLSPPQGSLWTRGGRWRTGWASLSRGTPRTGPPLSSGAPPPALPSLPCSCLVFGCSYHTPHNLTLVCRCAERLGSTRAGSTWSIKHSGSAEPEANLDGTYTKLSLGCAPGACRRLHKQLWGVAHGGAALVLRGPCWPAPLARRCLDAVHPNEVWTHHRGHGPCFM